MRVFAALLAVSAPLACGACSSETGTSTNPKASTGVTYQFVVDNILLPSTKGQYATDLDGNGTVDDQLGGLLSELGSVTGGSTGVGGSVSAGSLVLLHEVIADDLTNDPEVSWQLYEGMPQGAPVFDGTGAFTVAPISPRDDIMTGAITGGVFQAVPHPDIKFVFALGSEQLLLDIRAASITGPISTAGCNPSNPMRFTGGITEADFDTKILPLVADAINGVLRNDCSLAPGASRCGCPIFNLLDSLILSLDTSGDCNVTTQELLTGPTASMFAPDADLFDANNRFQPGADGVLDSLGLGFAFTCVGATFTP